MNSTYNPEIVLNLRELLWDLISQWKAILLASILVAILVSSAKFAIDSNKYDSYLEEQKQRETTTISVEDLISATPADDSQIIKYLVQEQRLINMQKNYLNNSIWLSDPTNQRILSLKYYIESNSSCDLQPLADVYGTCLRKNANIDMLRQAIAPDTDLKYIYEIFNAYSGTISDSEATSIVYTTNVILPAGVDSSSVEKVVNQIVENSHDYVSEIVGEHTIRFINREETFSYNAGAVDRRVSINNSINSLQNNINAVKGTLSDEGKSAFETISLILSEEISSPVSEANSESAGDASDEIVPEDVVHPASFSKKYAMLGFILGIFIYAGIFLVAALVKGKVQSAKDLSLYTGNRLVGNIYLKDQRKDLLHSLLHSNLVYNIRFKNKPDTAAQIEKVSATIGSVCDHASIDDITLFRMTGADDGSSGITDAITTKLKANGLKSSTIDISGEIEERTLLPVRNAIFVAGNDNKRSDIFNLSELCRSYDINQLGNVFIGKY